MAETIVKKKKRFKRRNGSVAKFAAMFENPQNIQSETQAKPRKNKKKKKVKKKIFENPHHWNNQYILYVQKHNKKPTAPQLGFFCDENVRSLEDRKKIIKFKQSQSIEQIKKERIIHRHHSQIKSCSFRLKSRKKPDISWKWRCDNLQTQLKEIREKYQPKTISKKKPRDYEANLLITGYFRLVLGIEVPGDIVSCCYMLFYDTDGLHWKILYMVKQRQFTKLTIVDRASYVPIVHTSAKDIATAWTNGDKFVNENQQLLDDWSFKKTFCFYGVQYNIVTYLKEDKELLCKRDYYDRENKVWMLDVLVAKETDAYWVILTKEYAKRWCDGVTSVFAKAGKFIDDLLYPIL